ncbi:MAG TPA: hypothetical protein PKL31_01730 [Fulvivirga sp.]|nr:hypothetical protein [Fulvivirga sp.]
MERKKTDDNRIKIIDNSYFSIGFPDKSWDDLVPRDNYLTQIVDKISSDCKILFLEGEEDSGKTTILAQFARKYMKNTITVFFNPRNVIDYQLEFYCANVYYQISNILGLELSQDNGQGLISIEDYRSNLFNLRKKLKQKSDKIYLLIDGLDGKIQDDPEFVNRLFEIMPIGDDSFRIVISGYKAEFSKLVGGLKRMEDAGNLTVSGFSKPEISNFLKLEDGMQSQFEELYKITKGYPGRLMTLKRLIESDSYGVEDISSNSTYGSWIEMDCESVDLKNKNTYLIFSLISLREDSFSSKEISQILNIELSIVQQIIEDVNVVDLVGEKVILTSSAHKKYYSNQLRSNSKVIHDHLINYYANSDSIKALIELPKLYMDQNDWGKVVSVLDGDTLPQILEKYGSLNTVNETLEMGISASTKLGKHSELWRFSIQGGIVNELDSYSFWESEVEARIAINDFSSAIKLAESAVLKIDRFRLLALIARRQKELTNSVDEELVTLIQVLYESTELHKVGNRIYDIVSDLIYAIPNLAIELIEKSSGSISDKNINDWVIAKLAVAAIDSSSKDDKKEVSNKKLEAVQKLNAPLVKKITKAISFLVGNYTAGKVIEEASKLSDSNERLRLLRLWLNNNKTNITNIEDVISLALDELVDSTSKDSFTLDILKDLSFQLPYVKDTEKKQNLLNRFQNLESNFTDLGPITNKYIYQLNIFHAKHSLGQIEATDFINAIIKEIEGIEDVLVKLDSFSEVYAKLIILRGAKFDLKPKINFLHSRLLTLSSELYKTTASHYKISQTFLSTISNRNPVLALTICSQINTENRRENARLLILDSYLDNNLRHVKIEILKKIEGSLAHQDSKNDLIIRILERYSEAKSLHFKVVQNLLYFINKISFIDNVSTRSFAQMLAYKVIAKDPKWKLKLSGKISSELVEMWNGLDKEWEKIDIGFRICFHLSKIDNKFSSKVFESAMKMKESCWMDSLLVAQTYLISLSLIIKSYNSLLKSRNDNLKDYKIVEDLINQVPSKIERIKTWTELAIYSFGEEREDISRKVVETHIIPLLKDIDLNNNDLNEIIEAFIPTHIYNADLFKDLINPLSSKIKEKIYSALCDFYITKRNPFEIYDGHSIKYHTSHNELLKAIKILNEIKTDSILFTELSKICKAISDNKSISKVQVASLAEEILNVVHNKFPDPNNIKHEGYQILTELKLSLLDKRGINHKTHWKDLITRAEAIPNMSDLIFINSLLLDEIPFDKMENGTTEKRKLFNSTLEYLEKLPAHYETVQRVIDITDTMYTVDRTKWKVVVSNAFSLTKKLEAGVEVYQSQKNIIDSMYRLEPEFAKKLVKMVDNNNEPASHSSFINEHLQTLELSNKIKNNKSLTEKEIEDNRKVVYAIVDAQRALNSDRIATKKISEITQYLSLGNKLPLHEVFPVFMYYLTNCAKTYKGKTYEGNVADLHRNNFEEAVRATNIVQVLSHKRKSSESSSRKFFIDEDFSTNKALHPGSREEGINFIRNWLIDEAEEFVIIADPYLDKECLDILKLITGLDKDLEVDLLGSKDGYSKIDHEELFKSYWKSISDQTPPFTNVTFCWVPDKNNAAPFHDRWIISKSGGLRIGTSFNSIGGGKESEISVMKPSEALNIKEQTLAGFVSRKRREINGMRITYKSFSI